MAKSALAPLSEPRASRALLTIEEVAERLKIEKQLVRKLIESGALRSMRVGRLFRIREAWLEDYIERASQ